MSKNSGIVFHEDGQASEPCCWSCRDFTLCLGDEPFCVRLDTSVDRGDLCSFWQPRPSVEVFQEEYPDTPSAPPEDFPSSFSIPGVIGAILVGLLIFILVRHGESWSNALESRLGIANDIWWIVFIILGVVISLMALMTLGALSANVNLKREGEAPGKDSRPGYLSLPDSLRSKRTERYLELLENADAGVSLAPKNREFFKGSESWEFQIMLALVYERTAALLKDAISGETNSESAAMALSWAANLVDGVPDHEETISRWRNAPSNLDSWDWSVVAKMVTNQWPQEAVDCREAAKQLRNEQYDEMPEEIKENKQFQGTVHRCLNCNLEVPETCLQCPACGSDHLMWE